MFGKRLRALNGKGHKTGVSPVEVQIPAPLEPKTPPLMRRPDRRVPAHR
jgi:hypothetical protein